MKIKIPSYHLPATEILNKIKRFGRRAGAKVVYAVLLMYYSFLRKETPKWAKASILGSLAYFLSPLDFIPDLTPLLGFTDDLAVLMTGLVTISAYINQDVKLRAKAKMDQWFDTEATIIAIEDLEKDLKKKAELKS